MTRSGGTTSPNVSPPPIPGLYGAWTGEQVTSAVRPHGLKSIQIKRTVDGRALNRRGLARTALHAALDDRAEGTYELARLPPPPAGATAGPDDSPDARQPSDPGPLPVAAPLPARLPAPLGR